MEFATRVLAKLQPSCVHSETMATVATLVLIAALECAHQDFVQLLRRCAKMMVKVVA